MGVLANAIRYLQKATRAGLSGRLRAEAEAIKGATGEGGLSVTPELVAHGLVHGDAQQSVAIIDGAWQAYRDRGYEGVRPYVTEGYVIIFLSESDRVALEQQQPPAVPPSPPPEGASALPAAHEAPASAPAADDGEVDERCKRHQQEAEEYERVMDELMADSEYADFLPDWLKFLPSLRAEKPVEPESGDEGQERQQIERQPTPAEMWDGAVTLRDVFRIRAGMLHALSLPTATRRRLQRISQTLPTPGEAEEQGQQGGIAGCVVDLVVCSTSNPLHQSAAASFLERLIQAAYPVGVGWLLLFGVSVGAVVEGLTLSDQLFHAAAEVMLNVKATATDPKAFPDQQRYADRIERLQLPPDAYRRLVVSVLSSLAAIHGAGWIHRDANPQNIMVVCHAARLGSQWINFEMATRRSETEQPLPSLPSTPGEVDIASVPAPHADPAALRKVADTTEAVISRTATRSSSTLRLPFSAEADTYSVCSLSAALLIAPHMDHPDGSDANTAIYEEAGAFFVDLYDRHFVAQVARETKAMETATRGADSALAFLQALSGALPVRLGMMAMLSSAHQPGIRSPALVMLSASASAVKGESLRHDNSSLLVGERALWSIDDVTAANFFLLPTYPGPHVWRDESGRLHEPPGAGTDTAEEPI
ncbi:unnamed protein product [Vitrella brassicaformis CCMP3155]|uniref:Protein kinase domain-containing protein n=1 Tax=Vitrella brassicaformis (strain CCMP3155) TaxID=1169540 RepID=A0A0G4F6J7_VITBC|nr:unnamed protein product [Vitrella brassicaformis CCMP3155]|eukprot:CEM08040.1 unnamed protein product [Vitrella brassicaformis CCMP3155]